MAAKGQQEEDGWEGASRPAILNGDLKDCGGPIARGGRPRTSRQPDPALSVRKRSPGPRDEVLRVPLSHLDSGGGPAQGHRAKRCGGSSNRARVTEPFPAGQDGGSLARRHPEAGPGCGPAAGGVGREASGSLSKRRNSPHRRLVVRHHTRPRAGPGPSARLQVPEGRAARAGRAARLGPGVTSPHLSLAAAPRGVRAAGARGLTGIRSPHRAARAAGAGARTQLPACPTGGGVLTAGREGRGRRAELERRV